MQVEDLRREMLLRHGQHQALVRRIQHRADGAVAVEPDRGAALGHHDALRRQIVARDREAALHLVDAQDAVGAGAVDPSSSAIVSARAPVRDHRRDGCCRGAAQHGISPRPRAAPRSPGARCRRSLRGGRPRRPRPGRSRSASRPPEHRRARRTPPHGARHYPRPAQGRSAWPGACRCCGTASRSPPPMRPSDQCRSSPGSRPSPANSGTLNCSSTCAPSILTCGSGSCDTTMRKARSPCPWAAAPAA